MVGVAIGRPSNDIIDFETDLMEHEQEGVAGKAVEGEYSWIAPNGEEIVVKYIADHLGFRVLDSENIVPEVDDAEEAEPRAADLEAEEEDDDVEIELKSADDDEEEDDD